MANESFYLSVITFQTELANVALKKWHLLIQIFLQCSKTREDGDQAFCGQIYRIEPIVL